MRPWHYLTPVDYTKLLETFRADRCVQYPLHGWRAIGEWLASFKLVPRPPTSQTLRKWNKKYGMPVMQPLHIHGTLNQPWTTNLHLSAWLASQGRALSLPRWHPYRLEVEARHGYVPETPPKRMPNRNRRAQAKLLAQRQAELAALDPSKS